MYQVAWLMIWAVRERGEGMQLVRKSESSGQGERGKKVRGTHSLTHSLTPLREGTGRE